MFETVFPAKCKYVEYCEIVEEQYSSIKRINGLHGSFEGVPYKDHV